MVAKEIAMCIQMAAGWYDVPAPLLEAIHAVEGGYVGHSRENTNGSKDYGPMQINSLWVPGLAAELGASEATIRINLQNNACFNVAVGARIVKSHLDKTSDPVQAVGQYHSRTPHLRDSYSNKVVKQLRTIMSKRAKQDNE